MKKLLQSLKSFKELNKRERHLEIIQMIFSTCGVIFTIFMNVYTYKIFEWRTGIIRWNIIYLTCIFLGYFIVAGIRSKRKINLKHYSILGTIFLTFRFICFFSADPTLIMISYLLSWFGAGFRHVARNNYEFIFIRKKERGVYHANHSALASLSKIVLGLVISGIFFIAQYVWLDGYMILWIVAIIISSYLVRLTFSIPVHHEEKSDLKELKQLVTKKNVLWWGFLWLWWIGSIYDIIFPVASFYVLNSEIGLWSYESAITVISIISVLYLGKYIKDTNRIKVFVLCCLGIFSVFMLFAFTITRWAFIILTISQITLRKCLNLSECVNKMHVMDTINTTKKSTFSVVLMREILLYASRIVGLVLFIPFLWSAEESLIKYWFLGLGIGYLLIGTLLTIYTKREAKQTVEETIPLSNIGSTQPAFLEVTVEKDQRQKPIS